MRYIANLRGKGEQDGSYVVLFQTVAVFEFDIPFLT